MKTNYSFESVEMDDEFILVPIGGAAKQIQGVIRANEAGNKIAQMLIQGLNEEDVVDALAKEYDNDREILGNYVRSVARVLRDNHIIE